MTYGFASLAPFRQSVLVRLEDGPEEDSVGVELGDLTGLEICTADSLVDRGLAELSSGWRMTFWYRLNMRDARSWRGCDRLR